MPSSRRPSQGKFNDIWSFCLIMISEHLKNKNNRKSYRYIYTYIQHTYIYTYTHIHFQLCFFCGIPVYTNICVSVCFFCSLFCFVLVQFCFVASFQTGFLCVTVLITLELAFYHNQTLNSEKCACLYLQSVGIKNVHHHGLASSIFSLVVWLESNLFGFILFYYYYLDVIQYIKLPHFGVIEVYIVD